jgi:hypothetical protein
MNVGDMHYNKRDPKRIARIAQKIELLWSLKPELRFGQLISNLDMGKVANGLYFMSDETIERALEVELDDINRKEGGYELEEIGDDSDDGVLSDRNWT